VHRAAPCRNVPVTFTLACTMRWRVIPKAAMPLLLRGYGAAAAGAVVLASLVWVFGAPRSREQLAVTAATICLAVGGLFVGAVYAQALAAAGGKRWLGNLVLALLVASPALFVLLMPRGGPFALAIGTIVFLAFAHDPKRDGSG